MTIGNVFSRPSREGSLTQRAAWLLAAKMLGLLSSIILPVLLVRQMSVTEFGLYKQAFLIIATLMAVFPLGFAMSAFYFLPREPARNGSIVLNILIVYLLLGLFSWTLFSVAPGLPSKIFNSPELAAYSPLVGLAALFLLTSSFLEYVVLAHGEVRLAAAIVAGAQVSRITLLLGAAVLFGSLTALLYAAVLHGALLTAAALWYLIVRFPAFWRLWSWELMRSQLAYAIPLGAAGLLVVIQEDLHNYVVSHRFGPAGYAIYAVGCVQLPFLLTFREAVAGVMISRVSSLRHEGRTTEIAPLTARMLRKLAAVLLPLFFFLLVAGREFITVLFTPQYLASWPVFAVNLLLIPSLFLATAYDPILRAYPEHFGFLLKVRALLIGVLLGGLIWATGRFGLVGAISVVVTASILERFIVGLKVIRMLGLTGADWILLKPIVPIASAAAIAAVLAEWTRALLSGAEPLITLAGTGVAFGLAYLIAVWRLDVLAPEEIGAIDRQLRRLGIPISLRHLPLSPRRAPGS